MEGAGRAGRWVLCGRGGPLGSGEAARAKRSSAGAGRKKGWKEEDDGADRWGHGVSGGVRARSEPNG